MGQLNAHSRAWVALVPILPSLDEFGQCLVVRRKVDHQRDKLVAAPEVHAAFLAALNGTYGKVMTADAIMKELQA